MFTDEYAIYNKLSDWGYRHHTVCHRHGEFARDDDGDGFHEVHVKTIEGFWSLLHSWLRSHRGISQEDLPLYLGFFEFVHNVRKRGKKLLPALLKLLLTQQPETRCEPKRFLSAYSNLHFLCAMGIKFIPIRPDMVHSLSYEQIGMNIILIFLWFLRRMKTTGADSRYHLKSSKKFALICPLTLKFGRKIPIR